MIVAWPVVLAAMSIAALVVGLRGIVRLRDRSGSYGSPPLDWMTQFPSPRGLASRLDRLPASAPARGVLGSPALGRSRAAAVLGVGALALVATAIVPVALPMLLIAPLAAFALPDLLSMRVVAQRRRNLVDQLPDALDLLAVSARAGMTIDRAVDLVAERLGGPFKDEFELVRRELELGTSRRSALTALAERTAAEPVERLCAALIRAEELGTPVADALERLAGGMRHTRSQEVRERAAKAAPKIQLVVALLMVPATLMLVIGLLLIELARQVNAVIGAG